MKSHSMTLEELVKEMMRANLNAMKASERYNEVAEYITESETALAERYDTAEIVLNTKIRSSKDKSAALADAFNKYKFWKSEVERLSALIQGLNAYAQLIGMSPIRPSHQFYT